MQNPSADLPLQDITGGLNEPHKAAGHWGIDPTMLSTFGFPDLRGRFVSAQIVNHCGFSVCWEPEPCFNTCWATLPPPTQNCPRAPYISNLKLSPRQKRISNLTHGQSRKRNTWYSMSQNPKTQGYPLTFKRPPFRGRAPHLRPFLFIQAIGSPPKCPGPPFSGQMACSAWR